MRELAEDVKETAKQILHAAPAYEAYLKKQTGRSYKLLKPLLFKDETVTAKFLTKKPAEGGSPMGFILDVEYDAGTDYYNTKTSFYSVAADYKFNVVTGKEIAGIDFEGMMDPLVTLGQVKGWAPEEAFAMKGLKETVEALRGVLEQAKLGSGGRFKALVAKLKQRGDVRDPAAVAAAVGRKKYGKPKFQKLAAAGKK